MKDKKIDSSREKLITNMQKLLWERGYIGTSPKLIQKMADVGQGSMYHHFSSKADLALEAIKRNADELQTRNEEIFSEADSTSLQKIKNCLKSLEIQLWIKMKRLQIKWMLLQKIKQIVFGNLQKISRCFIKKHQH